MPWKRPPWRRGLPSRSGSPPSAAGWRRRPRARPVKRASVRRRAEAEARARLRAEQEAREAAERECRRLEQERSDGRALLASFVATYGKVGEFKEIAGQITAFLGKARKVKPCPPASVMLQIGAPAPIFRSIARLSAPGLALAAFQTAVSIADTHFVGRLGTEPLAGLALVFPLVMLLQMTSAGAMGGGVSSAIARARGGGNEAAARRLVVHALGHRARRRACSSRSSFSWLGRPLYALLGGGDDTLAQAIAYSDILFGGAVLVWLANTFAATPARRRQHRGPGGCARGRGAGPGPALGRADARLGPFPGARHPRRGARLRRVLRPRRGDHGRLRLGGRAAAARGRLAPRVAAVPRDPARRRALLDLGAADGGARRSSSPAASARFGTAALAGYGVGVRLELLQVPIVFAIGQALVILVGTHIGAGQAPRARRIAWAGTLAAVVGLPRDRLRRGARARALGQPVQQRRRRARRRQPLPAHRRAVLPVLRRRHGALLRRAGRRAGRPADPRRHGAPGGGRRRADCSWCGAARRSTGCSRSSPAAWRCSAGSRRQECTARRGGSYSRRATLITIRTNTQTTTARQSRPDGAVEERALGRIADADLGARLHAFQLLHRHSQAHAHRAGAGGEHHAGVGIGPVARLRAPAVDRVLEVADHGERCGGEAHRRPFEQVERAAGEAAEGAGVAPAPAKYAARR